MGWRIARAAETFHLANLHVCGRGACIMLLVCVCVRARSRLRIV